jgi:gag-polypeptide of LTR copia-type
MTEGSSLDTHMLRMTSNIEQLEKLNSPLSKEFATDVILNFFPPSYSNFIKNYYMLGMDKSLQEIKEMLRIADGEMKKSSYNIMIQEGGSRIKKTKHKVTPKVALKYKSKRKMVPNQNTPRAKASSTSDSFCCQSKGHWKRNCPKYLEVVRTGNVLKNSTSDIFVVEVNVVTSIHDCILDTGSCAHICSNMEALKNKRKLRNKEIQLRVGNSAATVTVGSIELYLPSGLIMKLENEYFVPSISRNIISISCQEMNDFSSVIKDNGCSIYKYELYYGSSL